jgi:hypothetical protein
LTVVAQNLHLHVRAQAAVIPQRQAGFLCECGVWSHAEAEDDHIGRDGVVGGQRIFLPFPRRLHTVSI